MQQRRAPWRDAPDRSVRGRHLTGLYADKPSSAQQQLPGLSVVRLVGIGHRPPSHVRSGRRMQRPIEGLWRLEHLRRTSRLVGQQSRGVLVLVAALDRYQQAVARRLRVVSHVGSPLAHALDVHVVLDTAIVRLRQRPNARGHVRIAHRRHTHYKVRNRDATGSGECDPRRQRRRCRRLWLFTAARRLREQRPSLTSARWRRDFGASPRPTDMRTFL